MNQYFQLQIPVPCHESWDSMTPTDRGRSCQACNKTVIDFTALSDEEIIKYLSAAGQGICGNFSPEQLNRKLTLQPPASSRQGRIWYLLLAGLLTFNRGNGQSKHTKARPVISWSPVRERIAPTEVMPAPVKDSFKVLKPFTVRAYTNSTRLGGAMSMVVRVSTWDKIKDTLADCHLLPKKELTVYPNPIRRGAAISLAWRATPGTYHVGIYNSAGATVEQRVLQVVNSGQVDLWQVPAGIAAGVYFIRADRADGGKGFVRQLAVL